MMGSISTTIRRLGEDFRNATRANVTTTFALACLPLTGVVGAAVDYSQANSIKTAMQAAADSTALMLSKDASILTAAQMQTRGTEFFKALLNRPNAQGVTVTTSYVTVPSSKVTVVATATMRTQFMGLLGFQNLNIGVDSQVAWGNIKLRVALALDTTGSMAQSNKIGALKTAAKAMLLQLQTAARTNGDVLVSIVPFSKDVNVGTANVNATWLDWDEWEEENGNDVTTTTCTNKKGKKVKCTSSTSWVPDNHNKWNGCVTDREKDSDVTNETPDPKKKKTLFVTEQYDDCPASILPLTSSWYDLNRKIEELQPAGNTNQGIGLAWAWHSLSQGAPLNAPPLPANQKVEQAIVLMSDGMNTENRWDDEQKKIDDRVEKACKNAKAAGITIYTVLVMTSASDVMAKCASEPSKAYVVDSTSGLVSVFKDIGNALSQLRISQ